MLNIFNRGGIINERKINIKGCCKQLLDTSIEEQRNNVNYTSYNDNNNYYISNYNIKPSSGGMED